VITPEAVDSFVAKWRARWPEWDVAMVFVPAEQRPCVQAWFCLLQDLTDAAWAGSEATPGLAKLAWWQEELTGWSRGARRHPIGAVLQPVPAPWAALGASLLSLHGTRERAGDGAQAFAGLAAFAAAAAACESAVFGLPAGDPSAMQRRLLGQRLLADPAAACPVSEDPADWTRQLLHGWPAAATRPAAIQDAVLQERLRRGPAPVALRPWQALRVAWRAARRQGSA
jgi:hypothetical protein